MPNWAEDPVAQKFQADPELESLCQRALVAYERTARREAYVRQQWEAARAGVKVALDALHAIWPFEWDVPTDSSSLPVVIRNLEHAWIDLEEMAVDMQGEAITEVQRGTITTMEKLLSTYPEVAGQ